MTFPKNIKSLRAYFLKTSATRFTFPHNAITQNIKISDDITTLNPSRRIDCHRGIYRYWLNNINNNVTQRVNKVFDCCAAQANYNLMCAFVVCLWWSLCAMYFRWSVTSNIGRVYESGRQVHRLSRPVLLCTRRPSNISTQIIINYTN